MSTSERKSKYNNCQCKLCKRKQLLLCHVYKPKLINKHVCIKSMQIRNHNITMPIIVYSGE